MAPAGTIHPRWAGSPRQKSSGMTTASPKSTFCSRVREVDRRQDGPAIGANHQFHQSNIAINAGTSTSRGRWRRGDRDRARHAISATSGMPMNAVTKHRGHDQRGAGDVRASAHTVRDRVAGSQPVWEPLPDSRKQGRFHSPSTTRTSSPRTSGERCCRSNEAPGNRKPPCPAPLEDHHQAAVGGGHHSAASSARPLERQA